jgi:hypothetical protein
MRAALAVLVLAAAPLLAGCAQAPSPPAFVPEAFEAVMEYDLPWGNRVGRIHVSLSPTTSLAADLALRPAYELRHGYPSSGDAPGSPGVPGTFRATLDGSLWQVRLDACPAQEGEPCEGHRLQYHEPREPPLGYGLPLLVPPGSEGRTDHADGSVAINGHRYAPGRLLPDVLDASGEEGPGSFRLVEYRAGAPLAPIPPWPAPPEPLPNETAAWAMFPGEDRDLFGAGWTPLEALEALRRDPEAAAILDGGGCVVRFDAAHRPRVGPLAGLQRDQAAAGFLLQDRDGASSRWSMARDPGLVPQGWTEPERDQGFPFPSEVGCDRMAAGPRPRLDAAQAMALLEPYVRWRAATSASTPTGSLRTAATAAGRRAPSAWTTRPGRRRRPSRSGRPPPRELPERPSTPGGGRSSGSAAAARPRRPSRRGWAP